MGGRHGLAEVVVVVNGQQVAVDVSVADHHLHVGDAVDVQYELVELLELAGLDAVHREPAELGAILRKKIGNRSKRGEEAIRGENCRDELTGRGNGDVQLCALIWPIWLARLEWTSCRLCHGPGCDFQMSTRLEA